jgi:Protein of unknown function (DUF2865)
VNRTMNRTVPVWRRSKRMLCRAMFLACAWSAVTFAAMPDRAQAQGFFDFLFGGFHDRQSPQVNSYAEPGSPVGRVAPAPLGSESIRQSSADGGRAAGFCVRLCDGRHFPLERMSNATPVEICRAMCPASATKVFFGGDINRAVAKDGQRYANIDNAFVYRQRVIPNCSCNGKDAFGLVPLDVKNDPTLRPGDIVSTKEGLMSYSGRRPGQPDASFSPVTAAQLTPNLNPPSSHVRVTTRADQPVDAGDDEGGTIVPAPDAAAKKPPVIGELRGDVLR